MVRPNSRTTREVTDAVVDETDAKHFSTGWSYAH